MPNSLLQQIAADATAVFLATGTSTVAGNSSFATEIKHWPAGESDNEEAIPAVVIEDDLEGNNQVDGDGRAMHNEHGLRIRESLDIHVSADVDVCPPDGKRGGSIFLVDDNDGNPVAYHAKRLLSRDGGLQRWICTRVSKKITRSQRERG